MKRSKKYEEAAKKVDRNKIYSPIEAATLAKETTTVKYDATIECAMFDEFVPLAQRLAAQGYRVVLHDRRNTGATDIVIEGDVPEETLWLTRTKFFRFANNLVIILAH